MHIKGLFVVFVVFLLFVKQTFSEVTVKQAISNETFLEGDAYDRTIDGAIVFEDSVTPGKIVTTAEQFPGFITASSNHAEIAMGLIKETSFSSGKKIAYYGNLAVLARDSDGASVLDISDIENPVELALISDAHPQDHIFQSVALSDDGRYAFLIDEGNNGDDVTIFDLDVPSSPVEISTATTGSSPSDVIVSGNMMIATYSNGFEIFDISNINSISSLSTSVSVPSSTVITNIVLSGTTLFVGDQSGVFIYDISTPASPILEGSYTSGININNDMFVEGNYLYLAGGTEGLTILDVTDTTNPGFVSNYAGDFQSCEVKGEYIFLGTNGEISVVDITTKSTPTSLSSTMTITNLANDIVFKNDIGIIASENGIAFFNYANTIKLTGNTTAGNHQVDIQGCNYKGECTTTSYYVMVNCAVNQYFDTGSCEPCPSTSTISTQGLFTIDDCNCPDGNEMNGSYICELCGVDTFKNSSMMACAPCPSSQTTDLLQGQSECVCKAGFFGANCEVCPVDTYKNAAGSQSCTSCHSDSSNDNTGSIDIGDCLCNPGFYFDGSSACLACTGNTYKTDAGNALTCDSCPGNSISNGTHCNCDKGYEGDGSSCSGCPIDSYKDTEGNTMCISCAENRTTDGAIERVDAADCVCKPGFFGGSCEICPVDTYKNAAGSQTCTSCHSDSSNDNTGSIDIGDCLCNPGFYFDGSSACLACTGNTYKTDAGNALICDSCPTGSISNGTHCSCPIGFEWTGSSCDECGEDSYKDTEGNHLCTICPLNSTTNGGTGSTLASDCICKAGFYDKLGDCVKCEIDTYKNAPGSQSCTSCHSDSSTVGELGSTECLCDPGFYFDGSSACVACSGNTFKSNSGNELTCSDCATNSVTTGTSCNCEEGYEGNGETSCLACNNGFYKDTVGNTMCVGCDPSRTTVSTASTDISMCVCKVGNYDDIGTCVECLANYYKDVAGDQDCSTCPLNTTTDGATGSIAESACICSAGYYYSGSGTSCFECPTDTYKDSVGNALSCQSCPTNSISDGISCTCNKGYEKNGATCDICGVDTYKDTVSNTDMCTGCGTGKTTDGSTGVITEDGCVCVAGRFGLGCDLCPQDHYKDTAGFGDCTICPDNTTTDSVEGTNSISGCVCKKGYTESNGDCLLCPEGSYKTIVGPSACISCQAHASTDGISACTCDPGYYDNAGTCLECPIDTFKDWQGNEECTMCGSNSTTNSATGADSELECECKAGYYYNPSKSLCLACEVDTYKDNIGSDFFCPSCKTDSTTDGAIAQTKCDCIAGTTLVGENCNNCAIDTYKDFIGDGDCSSCPENAVTGAVTGATDSSSCVCDVGYYYSSGDGKCVQCAADTYKDTIGNGACTPCSNVYQQSSTNGVLGATSSDQCICNAGYYKSTDCALCPADTYKSGNGDALALCLDCPAHSAAPQGSTLESECICVNKWQDNAGRCDECPGNWDEYQDCSACKNNWEGTDCDSCPAPSVVDLPLKDCQECLGNRNPATSCSDCKNYWTDYAGNCLTCDFTHYDGNCENCINYYEDPTSGCTTCSGNFDATCSSCKDYFTDESNRCQTCPAHYEQTECKECINFWTSPETGCNTCSPNFEQTNCLTCRNHWTNTGNQCNDCPGNWDSTQDCNACIGNFDSTNDCSTCIDHWEGGSCDSCPINFEQTECKICNDAWTGADCDQCDYVHYESDCKTCRDGWYGENCDQCDFVHWNDQCTACRNKWTGTNCLTCTANYDAASGCSQCENNWDISTECTQCLDYWTEASDCTLCPANYEQSECKLCINNWETPATGCTSCDFVHFDSECDQCRNYFDSVGCLKCPSGFEQSACAECRDGWQNPANKCEDCDFDHYNSTCNGCKNHFYGKDCLECPQNFVTDTCSVCEGNYDINTDCTECLGYYQKASGCTFCPERYDASTGCTKCEFAWKNPDNQCSECDFDHYDDECKNCRDHWFGTDCLECDFDHFLDDCVTCKNQFFGDDCLQCPPNYDAANGCLECEGNYDIETQCTTCIGNYNVSEGCSNCEDYWVGDECETCPFLLQVVDGRCNQCKNEGAKLPLCEVEGQSAGDYTGVVAGVVVFGIIVVLIVLIIAVVVGVILLVLYIKKKREEAEDEELVEMEIDSKENAQLYLQTKTEADEKRRVEISTKEKPKKKKKQKTTPESPKV